MLLFAEWSYFFFAFLLNICQRGWIISVGLLFNSYFFCICFNCVFCREEEREHFHFFFTITRHTWNKTCHFYGKREKRCGILSSYVTINIFPRKKSIPTPNKVLKNRFLVVWVWVIISSSIPTPHPHHPHPHTHPPSRREYGHIYNKEKWPNQELGYETLTRFLSSMRDIVWLDFNEWPARCYLRKISKPAKRQSAVISTGSSTNLPLPKNQNGVQGSEINFLIDS